MTLNVTKMQVGWDGDSGIVVWYDFTHPPALAWRPPDPQPRLLQRISASPTDPSMR